MMETIELRLLSALEKVFLDEALFGGELLLALRRRINQEIKIRA